jgi:hypothetical protein
MPGKKSVAHRFFLVGLFLLLCAFFALEPRCVEAKAEKRIGVLWFGIETRYAEHKLPYETLPVKQLDLILNLKTAHKGNFRIAPSFMKQVTKTIE